MHTFIRTEIPFGGNPNCPLYAHTSAHNLGFKLLDTDGSPILELAFDGARPVLSAPGCELATPETVAFIRDRGC